MSSRHERAPSPQMQGSAHCSCSLRRSGGGGKGSNGRVVAAAFGFLLLALLQHATADFVDDVVYQAMDLSPCTRLLNASGVIGCQNFGASGVLYAANEQDDISRFVTSTPKDGFVVVMPMQLLTAENLDTLRGTGKLNGVVVKPGTPPSSFSPDVKAPAPGSSFEWNPKGTGLNFRSFDFPIYAAWPTSEALNRSLRAIEEALTYNAGRGYSDYPLYSGDFEGKMYAAVDSTTCLRRGQCDPVGSVSVWATHSRSITADDQKPIVVLTAGLDASSFFHDLATGLNTHVAGMVGVMAVADAMSRSPINASTFPKHILYTLFSAEQWHRAGSQRFVRDVANFTCLKKEDSACPLVSPTCGKPCMGNADFRNISLGRVEGVIELSQIGGTGLSGAVNPTFYAHVPSGVPASQALAARLVAASTNTTVPIQLAGNSASSSLPPSSAQAFVDAGAIPAVVVADHQGAFTNPYWNSEFDDISTNSTSTVPNICAAASAAAKTIWRLAQGLAADAAVPAGWDVNCTLVRELVGCFAKNFSCSTVTGIPFSVNGAAHVSHYPSVWNFYNPSPISHVVSQWMISTLAWHKGSACNSTDQCIQNGSPSGTSCIYNRCVAATVRYHFAYGTGIEYDYDKGYYTVVDPTKGTWTESRWYSTGFRVFMSSSQVSQGIELLVGLVVFIVSMVGLVGAKRWVRKMKED